MNSVSAELDEQGHYSAVLPVGDVTVSVDNREWEPQPALGVGPLPPGLPPDVRKKAVGGGGEKKPDGKVKASPKYLKIPERYYDIETSDLKFTVPRGDLKKDLELKK